MRLSSSTPAAYISLIYYPGIWLSETLGWRSAVSTAAGTLLNKRLIPGSALCLWKQEVRTELRSCSANLLATVPEA